MSRCTLRFALAITLAILGAWWFAVDFSSSYPAEADAIAAGTGGADAAASLATSPRAAPRYPWPSRAVLGTALAGGAIADPPFGPILAVAGCYLVGRLSFRRWSVRR